MTDDTLLPFDLPAVCRKKVTAAFDGGRLSSDGGVLLLRGVERRLDMAGRLAGCLRDRRDPTRIDHTVEEMLRLRMFAIAAGYEDADDCDLLRHDPAFMMAVGRLPETGRPLCSQPTMSRLENAPSRIEVARMMMAMVDLFCDSFGKKPPKAITLDIDDTCDQVHGQQQLSLFNAHYDALCFLPIHVYDGATGRPVTTILRQGSTPTGVEVRTVIKHLVARIRRKWPTVRITLRGDSHYGRHETMAWCEENGVDYIFGLAGNTVLAGMIREAADEVCVRRALSHAEAVRHHVEITYGAKSWKTERKVIARIEATPRGLDTRYIITTLPGTAEMLYETAYCARGQAENLIKLHKAQLASDRTSCSSPVANQFRLILHTAAYWLMVTVRETVPAGMPLRIAEFNTLRLRLLKVAARIVERASRIRVHFPSSCPDQALFRLLVVRFASAGS